MHTTSIVLCTWIKIKIFINKLKKKKKYKTKFCESHYKKYSLARLSIHNRTSTVPSFRLSWSLRVLCPETARKWLFGLCDFNFFLPFVLAGNPILVNKLRVHKEFLVICRLIDGWWPRESPKPLTSSREAAGAQVRFKYFSCG